MQSLVSLIASIGLIALVLTALKAFVEHSGESTEWPFYAKCVMTEPEQVLYYRLVSSLPDHLVLAQVQVSRVLGVKKGSNFHEWNNRINRLSYDFVVCAKDASVVAVIELDDKTHDSPTRQDTDAKKNRATKAAGVKMVRWNVAQMPDHASIRSALFQVESLDSRREPAFRAL